MHGVLIISALFFYFFTAFAYKDSLPRGVHQWAQADRYAIAANFVDGQQFTHPATYSIISDDGEVGVEFPAVQFISAKLALLFNVPEGLPFIYRLFTFLILYSGFYLLIYEIFKEKTLPWLLALSILFFSSPILIFYGHNFSADAAALGLILASMSLTLKNNKEYFYSIILLLGLSALIKTSSGIYLIAYAGMHFLLEVKNAGKLKFWIQNLSVLSVLLLIAWYDKTFIVERNDALWSTLFLSKTIPIKDISELGEVFKGIWGWKMEYFNAYQWILIISGFYYFLFRAKTQKLKIYSSLIGLGLIAVIILFGKQFINHDYYFLATFTPAILLISLLGLKHFLRQKGSIALFAISLFAILSFTEGSNQHFDRMSETCEINGQTHVNYFEWLYELQDVSANEIDQDESVFVVYQLEPNLSLCYMKRMGIVFNPEEMGREESNFYYWLERRKPSYVVCKNKHFELFKTQHREFIDKCEVENFEHFKLLKINGY